MGGRSLVLALFLVQAMHALCDNNFQFRTDEDAIQYDDYQITIENKLFPERNDWVKFRCSAIIDDRKSIPYGLFELRPGMTKVMVFYLRPGTAKHLQISCRFVNNVNQKTPRKNVVIFDTMWKGVDVKNCHYNQGGCILDLEDMADDKAAAMNLYIRDRATFLGEIPDADCRVTTRIGIRTWKNCRPYKPEEYDKKIIGVDCPEKECPAGKI